MSIGAIKSVAKGFKKVVDAVEKGSKEILGEQKKKEVSDEKIKPSIPLRSNPIKDFQSKLIVDIGFYGHKNVSSAVKSTGGRPKCCGGGK